MRLKKHWLMIFALPSLFLLNLTGCSTTALKPVKTCPPATLMQERPVPQWTGKTWGDLAAYTLELRQVIVEHNADKAAQRDFCK